MQGKYIKYIGYNDSLAFNFFKQKQDSLIRFKEIQEIDDTTKKLNILLEKAQQGLEKVTNEYVTEEALKHALEETASRGENSTMSKDLEAMSSSIQSFFLDSDQRAQELRLQYENGYDSFSGIVEKVLKSGRVVCDKEKLLTILSNLSPKKIQDSFKDVANSLGWIGELSGMVLLSNIADELLESSFKGVSDSLKVEIHNTGSKRTIEDGKTLTTDNLLIIRQGDKVLFKLNLSNKLNTAYTAAEMKSTKRAIKLRSSTVGSFLSEMNDEEWSSHLYNIISYHWDENKGERVDYLTKKVGEIARQTVGIQMLFDHVYGTKGSFAINEGEIFKDEVHLIAYGTKIISSNSIVKNAIFTKAMKEKNRLIMATIDRSSWFKNGDYQGETYIQSTYDAERKISAFDLIYKQTLQIDIN